MPSVSLPLCDPCLWKKIRQALDNGPSRRIAALALLWQAQEQPFFGRAKGKAAPHQRVFTLLDDPLQAARSGDNAQPVIQDGDNAPIAFIGFAVARLKKGG
jgi:hypothetical protein